MPDFIGRFELKRELGRGAQSIVYLGFDPHLHRQVAIKALHLRADRSHSSKSGNAEGARLMAEARAVSNLRHNNIVPIFEAGIANGDTYLVFEYVNGRDLKQVLSADGPMGPAQAAEVMHGVLGALAAAHDQGIIHRDMKPSNILVDPSGQPRVMDFGISVSVDMAGQSGPSALIGTPAYMAPEYVVSGIISPGCDLYAAGLILLELLTGNRAVQGQSVGEVLWRAGSQAITLPGDIDEQLGQIVLRACEREPAERYANARQMQKALAAYLQKTKASALGEIDAWDAKKQFTMEFLLRRMSHKSDFPALSQSVAAINRLAASDKESMNELSNVILRDLGLTNKILRLVNSASYRHVAGGHINTVSRAAIVLGMDVVSQIALNAMLFEHLENKNNAGQLREAFLRANLAASLAREVHGQLQSGNGEEAFICALFHGLGYLLALYYFPEEVHAIAKEGVESKCGEAEASVKVLGLSFEDLGVGIAHSWGFPKAIVASMRKLPRGRVKKPPAHEALTQVTSCFANELSAVITASGKVDQRKPLQLLCDRYTDCLQLSDDQISAAVLNALAYLTQTASMLGIDPALSPLVLQVKSWVGLTTKVPDEDALGETIVLDRTAVQPQAAEEAKDKASPASLARQDLTAGIHDIMDSLVANVGFSDILRIVLEIIYRAMGFDRVVLCLRDPSSNKMIGKFGFGSGAKDLALKLRFSLESAYDVFHDATARGQDVIVSDIDDQANARHVPAWYRDGIAAKGLVLFPLIVKNKAVALIYCDKRCAGEISIGKEELTLLKTMRDQAVFAIKQQFSGCYPEEALT